MKRSSLTRQLIGGVLLAELICAAVFSFVAVGHEMHGRRRAFDVMLRGRADSLLGAVQDAEDPDDNVVVDPTELVLPEQDVYAVLNPAGRVLGQSPVAPPRTAHGNPADRISPPTSASRPTEPGTGRSDLMACASSTATTRADCAAR